MSRRAAAAFAFAGLSFSAWSLSPAKARAQFPDLLDVSAQYMPSAALEDPRPAEAHVASYDASVNVPVPLGESTYLIPGLGYHVEAVAFSRTPPDFIDLRMFHAAEVALLFVQMLPSDWALSLRVAPGLAGDFRGFDSGLLRVNAVALATRSFSERLVLGGGGIVTFSFGSLLPLPAVYFDWKPLDGFQVEGFIPSFVNATYTIEDRVEIGVRTEIGGNAYAVRDERIASAWPCVPGTADDPATPHNEGAARRAQCLDHVAYAVGMAGVTFGVRAFDSVWLTAFAGHSIFRRFEMMNDDDERVPGGLQMLPNVFSFRSGITWRIPSS